MHQKISVTEDFVDISQVHISDSKIHPRSFLNFNLHLHGQCKYICS